MISIHAPLAGCDHRSAGQGGHGGHFSPRTPCGVRRGVSIVAVVGRAFQSTHPLRGATLCPCAFTCLLLHFNPRAPCGVRRKEFQDYSKRFHDISIHAPLAGCDPIKLAPADTTSGFQSTHPLRGATSWELWDRLSAAISIHAPLAGRDAAAVLNRRIYPYFNPRAPCGARPLTASVRRAIWNFNPRAPCGARPNHVSGLTLTMLFQSTRPLRGATTRRRRHDRTPPFQSTRPLRGATSRGSCTTSSRRISIHAPLAGRDALRPQPRAGAPQFQSTRPLRGATRPPQKAASAQDYFNPRAPCGARRQMKQCISRCCAISIHAPLAGRDDESQDDAVQAPAISIHAPLAGRDAISVQTSSLPSTFQSTRPLRGATKASFQISRLRSYFNPRAPCGVRRDKGGAKWIRHDFNPRAPCGVRPASSSSCVG